jgi:calpain-15
MELGELGKYLIASSLFAGVSHDSSEDILNWCKINDEKYTDFDFTASFLSLSHQGESSSKYKNWSKYRWLRISEFSSEIEIFKDTVSPLDILQGALGDSNFLCCLSILCEYPDLIKSLFITKTYNKYGLFSVNLCTDGVWTSYLLDDYFPCGQTINCPVFSQCIKGEAWVMIMEKAWAKRVGSYENTELSSLADCLRDLTGAPTREINPDPLSWDDISQCKERNYVVAASAGSTKSSHKLLETVGLLGNISYAVLRTADVGERIIQLRNSWSKTEWNGDWSDNSDKWTSKSKKKVGHVGEEDGTFWMSFHDFCEYFSNVTVCEYTQGWVLTSQQMSHDVNSFCVFEIEVPKSDEYVLSIHQKDKVLQGMYEKYDYSLVRIVICREGRRGTEYALGKKGQAREVSSRLNLRRGKYSILVMCDWVSSERDFVVSIYGSQTVQITNLGPVEGFLEKIYIQKSEELPPIDYSREGFPQIFKYHEFLPEGFGYFYIKNSSDSLALREKTFFKVFKNLKLLPPFKDNSFDVTVAPGKDCLILLKVTADDYRLESSSTYSKL